MESNCEFRIINELLQGIRVRNLCAYIYHDGKICYKLKFPKEKMYIYMEVEVNKLKECTTKILFKISKVSKFDSSHKNEEKSQLLGKYLLFEQSNNFKVIGKTQMHSSLDGTVTLQ